MTALPNHEHLIPAMSHYDLIGFQTEIDATNFAPLRMEAFGRFLSTHPEWRGKVTYLQITPKSRSEIQEYADMQR